MSLASIRPTMIRAQNEHRPPIPHNFQDLANLLMRDNGLGQTLDQDSEFFRGMVGQPGHRSLVFMSSRVVEGVAPCMRNLFGDGTFHSRPNSPPSAQLYILLTSRDNHVSTFCVLSSCELQGLPAFSCISFFPAIRLSPCALL